MSRFSDNVLMVILNQMDQWAGFAAHLLSCFAIVAAGWWFLYTTQFKPRVQFDIECRFYPLDSLSQRYVAEVTFVFENKGFVEHRLYDLSLSLHGLRGKSSSSASADSGRTFDVSLFPRQIIIPPKYSWYFVRPGVRQAITHQVILDSPGPLVQVTAGFSYQKKSEWPHTARRVFAVSPGIGTAVTAVAPIPH